MGKKTATAMESTADNTLDSTPVVEVESTVEILEVEIPEAVGFLAASQGNTLAVVDAANKASEATTISRLAVGAVAGLTAYNRAQATETACDRRTTDTQVRNDRAQADDHAKSDATLAVLRLKASLTAIKASKTVKTAD